MKISTPSRKKKQKAKFTAAPVAPAKPLPLPEMVQSRLVALRRRYRMTTLGEVFFRALAVISVLLLAQTLGDYWFDLPWLARAGFLLSDIVLLTYLYLRFVNHPLRASKTLAQTALMVEKKWPQLHQCLITAVELAQGARYSTRGSLQLVNIIFQQAVARTIQLDFKKVVPMVQLRRWILLGGVLASGTVAMGVATWPSSLLLVQRLVLMNKQLPTRTMVIPITKDLAVPLGSDVTLSVQAKGVIPRRGRLSLTYEGEAPREFSVSPKIEHEDVFAYTVPNIQKNFTYFFHLNDGQSPVFTVKAKAPPSIASMELLQVYPDYTKLPPAKMASGSLSLLAGSRLKVHALATDQLQSASIILQGVSQTVKMSMDSSKTQLDAEIPIPSKDLTGFSIRLTDGFGVSSANETVYPITVVPDKPPLLKIILPLSGRETITPQAKPVIAFDATDDYGITSITLYYQLTAPAIAGQEPSAAQEAQTISIPVKSPSEPGHYEYVFDASAQTPPWKEGWTVSYWIESTDNNTSTGPGISKTEHRQFSIISLAEKQAEMLERIQKNTEAIERLSDTQQKASTQVGNSIPQK